jgi:hypothetical protein
MMRSHFRKPSSTYFLREVLSLFSFFRKKKQKIAPYGNLPSGFCSKKSSGNQAVLTRKGLTRTSWFPFAQKAGADFLLQKPDGKFPEVALSAAGIISLGCEVERLNFAGRTLT